jgi:hypothetical protein
MKSCGKQMDIQKSFIKKKTTSHINLLSGGKTATLVMDLDMTNFNKHCYGNSQGSY